MTNHPEYSVETFGVADVSFKPIHNKRIEFSRQTVILKGVNNKGDLYLVADEGGEPLLIEVNGEKTWPTLDILRDKAARGEARVMDLPTDPATISAFSELFDPLAVLEDNKDARATWNLAARAVAKGISRSQNGVNAFLDTNYGVGPFDHDIEKPKWRAFIKAMNVVRAGGTIADIANRSGRKRGGTPFPKETDYLIHGDAMAYWAVGNFKHWEAYERHKNTIKAANSKLQPGAVLHKLISRSAFYERINNLECETTVAAKFGPAEAKRRFGAASEGIKANYCFEYGYIDSSRLENVIVFDEDSRLPFIKPWVTTIMDMKSGAILACHIHAGDPRAETTIQALLMSLTAPDTNAAPTDFTS